jgi:hypothetical protein
MNQRITYIFPSRQRPLKLLMAIANISEFSVSKNYSIIVVLDEDDEETKRSIHPIERVEYYFGKSESKIHACNRELDKISSDTQIVCLMSDDFVITERGFDTHIRQAFADGFKGLLHLPDNRVAQIPNRSHAVGFFLWTEANQWKRSPRGTYYKGAEYFNKTITDVYEFYRLELCQRLVTFPIMHIEYLRRFGYIYHPDYKSVRADDEQTEVAKRLNMYRYVDKQIMEHQHYRWGFNNGEPDELYKKNDSGEMYEHDRLVFEQRSAKNFDL